MSAASTSSETTPIPSKKVFPTTPLLWQTGPKLVVMLCGLMILVWCVLGMPFLVAGVLLSKIVPTLLSLVFPTVYISKTFHSLVLLPIARVICKDPEQTHIVGIILTNLLVVYPTLAYVTLTPFTWDYYQIGRIVLYYTAIFYYAASNAYIGLHHAEAHACWSNGGLVKPEWRYLFDRVGEWWFNPLIGIAPGMPSYTHVLIHHKYGNNLEDPQSTLWFDRSSLSDFFLLYCPMMIVLRHWGAGAVTKLEEAGQYMYAGKMLQGQWRMAVLYGLVCMLNFNFFLFGFLPIVCIFTASISSVEWSQHAFFDAEDEQCTPVLATTSVLSPPNQYRNEPWHIVHHALNTGHYTQNEKQKEITQLEQFVAKKPQKNSKLFLFKPKKEEFVWMAIFPVLMMKDFNTLAKSFVWTGAGERPAHEELVAYLKKCVQPLDLKTYTVDKLYTQQLMGPVHLEGRLAMKLSAQDKEEESGAEAAKFF
ncbi:hypothetical protein EON63_11420 [archaeon]|nr:MAG: hypothetical protein EON63_11420 [archaeon]